MPKFEIGLLCLVLISNILISGTFYPLVYLLVALCHECGHLLAFRLCAKQIKNAGFVGLGIRIDGGEQLTYRQEIRIAAAGPLTNATLGILAVCLYCTLHLQAVCYFALANVMYGLLNIVPVAPLDGHKILRGAVNLHFQFDRASLILKIVNIMITAILLIALLCLGIWHVHNISLWLICTALALNGIISMSNN